MRIALVVDMVLATGMNAYGASWSVAATPSNANHIFNSVHDSMRQWGSSLHHNGMSMFLATVPVTTEFYHGTSSQWPINGTEWLAFEPEHALVFASRGNGGPAGHGQPPPGKEHRDEHVCHDNGQGNRDGRPRGVLADGRQARFYQTQQPALDDASSQSQGCAHSLSSEHPADQNIIAHGLPSDHEDENRPGFLHTYRTKRDLRLLYVDGQSAAKSDKGTLDLQDLIIRDPTAPANYLQAPPKHRLGGPMNERERALELCHLAATEWEGKIDGILRMEAGFEVILCSFEDNLDIVSINQQQQRGASKRRGSSRDQWSYYTAVAARFDGIGAHRARLHTDHFLSVFAYPNAFKFDHAGFPRVINDTLVTRTLRRDLRKMVTQPSVPADSTDWQGISDLIVARYAERIAYLASDKTKTLLDFQEEADRAMKPFIDYANRDDHQEVARCASQFLDPVANSSTSLAAISVRETHTHICRTLLRASKATSHAEGMSFVGQLKEWLGWATWKRCRGCELGEVCMIPIWPWGSKADFEHPSCSDLSSDRRGDYWR